MNVRIVCFVIVSLLLSGVGAAEISNFTAAVRNQSPDPAVMGRKLRLSKRIPSCKILI